MSYHAIGMEAWQELPGLFVNDEIAKTLDEDTEWWSYTYSFLSAAQEGKVLTFDCVVKFRKSDHSFKKVMRPVEVT